MSDSNEGGTEAGEEIDRRSLGLFFGSLLAYSAAIVAVSLATGVGAIALAPVYMFGPMIAGVVTCIAGGPSFAAAGLTLSRGRLRWLPIAALVPIALVLAGLAVSLALPGTEFVPDANPLTGEGTEFASTEDAAEGPDLPGWPWNLLAMIALAVLVGASLNAVFAFGEEFGWRGVLLRLLSGLGFWRASLAIGVVWGLWHAPIILEGYNYPGYPTLGVFVMTAATVSMSPVYTYVAVRARTVLAPSIFHGVFNAFGASMIVFAGGGSELVVNPVGAVGIAVFGLAAVAIAIRGAPPLEPDWAVPDRDEGTTDLSAGESDPVR